MRPIATNSTHGVLLKRCVYYEIVQFNYLFFDIIIIIVIIVIHKEGIDSFYFLIKLFFFFLDTFLIRIWELKDRSVRRELRIYFRIKWRWSCKNLQVFNAMSEKNDGRRDSFLALCIFIYDILHVKRFTRTPAQFNTSQSFRSFIFLPGHLISIEFIKFISTQNPWCSWSLFEVRACAVCIPPTLSLPPNFVWIYSRFILARVDGLEIYRGRLHHWQNPLVIPAPLHRYRLHKNPRAWRIFLDLD